MDTATFDVQVRTIECQNCGAPVATSIEGGQVVCEYCGTLNLVATRRASEQAGTEWSTTDEVARLSRLKAQVEAPLSGHAYDLHRPPLGWETADTATPEGLDRANQAWRQARGDPPPSTPEEQRKLCWLAMKLADGYRDSKQALQARAVLETVLEMLQDSGHRHLIRCRLATEAIDQGDLSSGEGWLAECNAHPEVLELDSVHRHARALLYARQGDTARLLSVVGMREGDVPVNAEYRRPIAMLRIHGLEMAEHPERAGDALVSELALDGNGKMAAVAETDREFFDQVWKGKLNTAMEVHGGLSAGFEAFGHEGVLGDLDRWQLAPRTRQRYLDRLLGAQLQDLENQRKRLNPHLLEAAGGTLLWLPILALLLMLPVMMTRCSCDADPLQGAYGYPLCPEVCDGCRGPARVVTEWTQTGPGESSSNGPQFFCHSDDHDLDQMTDSQIEDDSHLLEAYELSGLAGFGASYLTLLGLTLALWPFLTVYSWFTDRKKLQVANQNVEYAARQLGRDPPARPSQRWRLPWAMLYCLVPVGIASVLVLIGMLL
jgi:DNA-directed RNA polymerase subunit RPC12/RpoP